jgi:hypothetical protein
MVPRLEPRDEGVGIDREARARIVDAAQAKGARRSRGFAASDLRWERPKLTKSLHYV